MRQLTAAIALVLALLALAPGALGDPRLGVNDDAGKYGNGDPLFFETMASLGLTENVMTVLWDPARPNEIAEQKLLERALPVAAAHGVEVVFDVYPSKALAFATDPTAPAQFAAFVAKLATTFPSVRQFIVMNECNQPRFLQPQFSGSRIFSAAVCGQAVAYSYDVLKAIDPTITVWGIGLSPRGNDNPVAPSNISTSPVRFLAALGRWYRSTGRAKPLLDGLAFHPYPNANTDEFARGYAWPKVGAVNLDRLYQAFWDAFHDTAQPTFAEWAPGGDSTMRLSVNEVGVQVDTVGKRGYTGTENVPAVDPITQASWYSALIAHMACDPHVASLNLFHLLDEPDRTGFQSGLFGLGWEPRPAADVVKNASRHCEESMLRWRHSDHVVDATVTFRGGRGWSISASASEDARYTVGVFAVSRDGATTTEIGRALAAEGSSLREVATDSGSVVAYRRAALRGSLRPGCYQIGVTMHAALNPERTSTFASRVLRVGTGC